MYVIPNSLIMETAMANLLYSAAAVLNLSARARMKVQGLSLDTLRVMTTLCGVQIDWSLKFHHLGVAFIWIGLTLVPGALWAGAITPIPSSTQHTQSLLTPSFSNNSGISNQTLQPRNSSFCKILANGTFIFAPEVDLQGPILNTAQDASSRQGGVSKHFKLDKSGFSYVTRSYGVGSMAGLTESFDPPADSYRYQETGLLATTRCIYNQSSSYNLDPFLVPSGWSLHVYNAEGTLPNAQYVVYAAASLGDSEVVAVGAASNNGSDSFVAFATVDGVDGPYASLGNIQCQIDYKSTVFNVSVNMTALSIKVIPDHEVEAFQNSAQLAGMTTHLINNLRSVLISTQWISVSGEIFMNNVLNVQAYNGTSNASTLGGVSMSLNSILDSFLEAFSAAQVMVHNDTQATDCIHDVNQLCFWNA